MRKHKYSLKTKAFTLIEMLLVLLIISLLLILIIPNVAKQTAHIQSTGCDAQLQKDILKRIKKVVKQVKQFQ